MTAEMDSDSRTLGEAGETELLHELISIARSAPSTMREAVHSGDDAAAMPLPVNRDLVITQDCLVEGKDFHWDWLTPADLGRRALRVAVSDLAGMGAHPIACLATFCAPAQTKMETALGIQRGLVGEAAAHGMAMVGGDISDIDGPLVIDVVALGTAIPGRELRRDKGRSGDLIAVTGRLGRAAAGLAVLLGDVRVDEAQAAKWRDAHIRPPYRVNEGMHLTESGINCGGDISDGLIVDLTRTAEASGTGAEIWADQLPIEPELREVFPERWLELALGGGEDFELLFTVSPKHLDTLKEKWPSALAPFTVVGQMVSEPGLRLLSTRGGDTQRLPEVRSRHYG